MSLNDKACSSTPSIVRDAAHFGTCTIGAGGFSTSGAGQFNDGFSVTDGDVEFGGQSITEVLGQWQFTYGVTCLGDTVIGASSGTHTLVVYSSETHHGGEVHNGTVTYGAAATVAFNAASVVTIPNGVMREGSEVSTITANQARTVTAASVMVFTTATVGPLAIQMSAPGGVAGVKKLIKNSNASTQSLYVVDSYSSQVIAQLDPSQSTVVVSDSSRWY